MKHLMFSVSLILLLTLAAAAESSVQAKSRNAGCIKPYVCNPHYWQYIGQPVLLLGGSKTDHIFLVDHLQQHLDEIARSGGNYVRNTMSQREGLDLKPYRRLASGKFDLNQWNRDYWKRFLNCLKWCRERNIIVQIEVWDRFDYSQSNWKHSPWRPDNNINYTNDQTGLADEYRDHPARDKQPFFHTVPGMSRYQRRYDVIREYQERFVAKMLSYSLDYGNVLYCMNNETSTSPKWGQYWMKFITEKAAKKGVEVHVTDMFGDAWKPETCAKLRQGLDNPQIYTFLDISQVNSRNFNEAHWEKVQWIVDQVGKYPRPLNNTKIYSAGNTRWGSGTPKDGVERFWRNLLAGAASCRFHRPGAGIGLNDTAKACISAARKVETLVKFWHVEANMSLLSNREGDEAYLAANPGKEFVLYFTDGGSVGLNLKGHRSDFKLKWVNISSGGWGKETQLRGDRIVTVTAPEQGPWVAAITSVRTKITGN